jgi:hypothetical protein
VGAGALTKGPAAQSLPADPIGGDSLTGLFVTGIGGPAGAPTPAAVIVDYSTLAVTSIPGPAFLRVGATVSAGPKGLMIVGGTHPMGGAPVLETEWFWWDSIPHYALGPVLPAPHSQHVALPVPTGTLFIGGNGAGLIEQFVADRFVPAGTLDGPAYAPVAAVLSSGDVLVAGGGASASLDGARTEAKVLRGDLSATSYGEMLQARCGHTVTLAPAGGFLVAGGAAAAGPIGPSNPALASAEVFDLQTGTFTSTGSMPSGRYRHSAAPGGSGVILAGGFGEDGQPSPSAVIYDGSARAFFPTGMPSAARVGGALVTDSATGVTVYAGGGSSQPDDTAFGVTNVEKFAGDTFLPQPAMKLGRVFHSASPLFLNETASGQPELLLIGGAPAPGKQPYAEVLSYSGGTIAVAPGPTQARWRHGAAKMISGDVVVAGGSAAAFPPWTPLLDAEIFHPKTMTFTSAGALAEGRSFPVALAVWGPGPAALFAGGSDAQGHALASAEIYSATTGAFVSAPPMASPRGPPTASAHLGRRSPPS